MKIGPFKIQSPVRFSANSGTNYTGHSFFNLWGQIAARRNSSKENVTPETSLQLSAYYAAIRNISEDIAKQPVEVIELQENGDIKILLKDPIQKLLAVQPNSEMTPITFYEVLTAHALGWGNGYAWIQRDRMGNPYALYPIHPSRVQVERDEDDRIYYKVFKKGEFCLPFTSRNDDADEIIYAQDMIHIKGLGGDGLCGYSVVSYASESFGAAIAAQKFSGAYFGNGVWSGGFITHPNTLSKEAQDNLVKSMERRGKGAENAHKLQVLEEGMQWKSTSVNPRDAQLVELRKWQVTDVARWFRMPPTKIGDFERATFSNIEHTNIDYNTDTLTPWATKWEQELKVKLFLDREGVTVRFNEDALLRGDAKSRAERDRIHWEIGVKSANEIRRQEGLNSYDGGEKRYRPLNFAPIGEEPEEVEVNEVPNDDEEASKIIEEMAKAQQPEAITLQPIVAEAVKRVNEKERKAVARKSFKEGEEDKAQLWGSKFYKSQYEYLKAAIEPVFSCKGAEIPPELDYNLNKHYLGQLETFIAQKEVEAVDSELTDLILKNL